MKSLGIAVFGRTLYMALVSREPTKPEHLSLSKERIPLGCACDEKGEYLVAAKRKLKELLHQVKPDVVGLKISDKGTRDAKVGENLWIKLQWIVEVVCAEANVNKVLLNTGDISRRLKLAEMRDEAIIEEVGHMFPEMTREVDVCKLYALAAAVSLLAG